MYGSSELQTQGQLTDLKPLGYLKQVCFSLSFLCSKLYANVKLAAQGGQEWTEHLHGSQLTMLLSVF
jgi:hypothetical protein